MKMKRLTLLSIVILVFFWVFSYASSPASSEVVIYGDSRSNHDAHRKIVKAIIQTKPDVIFHAGDLVENGYNKDDWKIFNEIVSELIKIAEFYPALGNHEEDSPLYFDNFDLPNNERWYSVDRDNIHFIVLDSNTDLSENSEQYRWLESDLRKNTRSRIKFTIAIFHHPPFSCGYHIEDELGLRDSIVPLFEKYGVNMVFNGHNHAYERCFNNDIYYIVTGGGGASLYSQTEEKSFCQRYIKTHHFCTLSIVGSNLVLRVYDSDLNLIDEIKISQRRKIKGR